MDYLAHLKQLHRGRIEPVTGPPCGASELEVAHLEAAFGCSLPEAYIQFLLWMGNDREGIYRGTDIFIGDVLENTQALPQLLSENGIERPAGRYLCFQSHQGYFMAWFALPKESEDPQIFYFGEGQGMTAPRAAGRFSEYVGAELADLAALGGTARSVKPRVISRLKSWLSRSRPAG